MASESQPLLHQNRDSAHQISWLRMPGEAPYVQTARQKTRRLLNSKLGHYFVLFLVSVDIICIFADFLISLYTCEKECCKPTEKYRGYHDAQDALGIVSLVFSSLFMVELAASIWAFGVQYVETVLSAAIFNPNADTSSRGSAAWMLPSLSLDL